MSSSIRFNFPFLAPGQAQKELYHNEALQLLDIVVAACVEEPPRSSPPSSPAVGASYLVAGGATRPWAGFDGHIAAFTKGGWRFVPPQEGLQAMDRSSGSMAQFREGRWEIGTLVGSKVVLDGQQVVSARGAAIPGPTGGTVVDPQARGAIQAILDRLQEHGLIAHP
jgi:hypothetical protein